MEMHLSDRDHTKIHAELKAHAADWREIGSALGLFRGRAGCYLEQSYVACTVTNELPQKNAISVATVGSRRWTRQ